MALCPFARQRLIPESHTQGRITPRVVIFHQAVSSAASLYGYWTSPGVELESHFYVYKDGSLDQYVDTEVRADANVEANGFAISVETWDNGGDDGEWTPEQLATLTRLAGWACETHGIPAEVPDGPYGSGIGWHNLFPTQWAGGPRRCPGSKRAAQVRNHIIPRVAAGNTEGDDVGWNDKLKHPETGTEASAADWLMYANSKAEAALRAVEGLLGTELIDWSDETGQRKYRVADWLVGANLKADRAVAEAAALREVVGELAKTHSTQVDVEALLARVSDTVAETVKGSTVRVEIVRGNAETSTDTDAEADA